MSERIYLVTGGAGFIGSHIAESLIRAGERVRVLDSFETGSRANLDELAVAGTFEFVEGDLRDTRVCKRACEDVEVVFHQAALPSVPRSIADPVSSFEINVVGTHNLLLAAREAGVRRVVQASSSSIYGDAPTLPKHEEMPPLPHSPYAAQKLAAEQLGAAFSRSLDIEVVALRYFNVFGPRQDPKSQYAGVLPRFVRALAQGVPPTIHGDGEQSRDFTYVDNVVLANRLAAAAEDAPGRVFNVGCGARITVNTLLRFVAARIGSSVSAVHGPARAGDVRHSLASIDKARALLGYEPQVSVEDGLATTVDWYMSREPEYWL